jgi:hypothetical protein
VTVIELDVSLLMVQEGLAVAVEYISFDLTSSKPLFEIVTSGVCAKTLREKNNKI